MELPSVLRTTLPDMGSGPSFLGSADGSAAGSAEATGASGVSGGLGSDGEQASNTSGRSAVGRRQRMGARLDRIGRSCPPRATGGRRERASGYPARTENLGKLRA